MKVKERIEQHERDVRESLSTRSGRRLFRRRLRDMGFYASTLSESVVMMAAAEGRRNAAINLLAEAQKICPDYVILSFSEELADAKEDAEDAGLIAVAESSDGD